MTETRNDGFMNTILDTKLLQYLGSYLAIGFGLLQFLEFITNRYDLSELLVDRYLLVWLLSIPAVIILILTKGKLSGKQGLLKMAGVFGNFALAFILSFLLIGKVEGESKIVQLTDESGKQIAAVIPSRDKTKSIAAFQFSNKAENEEEDWWGVAFSQLLSYTLSQRPEYSVLSEYYMQNFYDRLGLEKFSNPNVGMQRQMANRSRSDYFTRVSYEIVDGVYNLEGALYKSSNGSSVMTLKANNSDPFKAIDQLANLIVTNIPNPMKTSDDAVILPSSSLVTGDIEALKHLTHSRITFYNDPTALEEVVASAKKAVALDQSCYLCHYYVGDPLYGLGKGEEALIYLKDAVKYASNQPPRFQFGSKAVLYQVQNKMDAYFKLRELQRKMLPYEWGAYSSLIPLYQSNYGIDSAKALINIAIDNGNVERGLLALHDIQLENEEYKAAEQTLDNLKNEFPDREEDKRKYATIYENQGRLDEATAILEEVETLEPFNSNVQINLAYHDYKRMKFKKGEDRMIEALEQAMTTTDSANLMYAFMYMSSTQGRVQESLLRMEEYTRQQVKLMPYNRVLNNTLFITVDQHLSVGDVRGGQAAIDRFGKYSPEYAELFECIANFNSVFFDYPMLKDEATFMACKESLKPFGESYGIYFDATAAIFKEDQEKAKYIVDNQIERLQSFINDEIRLAKLYVLAGDTQKAEELLNKAIEKKSFNGQVYLTLAQLLTEKDPTRALENLEKAMIFWAQADSDFIPAQKARALQASLTQLQ